MVHTRSGKLRALAVANAEPSELTAGLPTVDMGKIGLAIAPSHPRVIYANIIRPIGTLQGIYRSTTGGDTWEKRSNNGAADWYGGAGYYFAGIRVDPDDAKTTSSLDIHLLRSTNGGRSVGPAEGPVHADWHDLIIDASRRWIAGTDGGVDISRDDAFIATIRADCSEAMFSASIW